MRADVGETTTVEVNVSVRAVVLLRLGGNVVLQVGLDGFFLVPGAGEVETETAGAGVPGDFGVVGLGAADGGYILCRRGLVRSNVYTIWYEHGDFQRDLLDKSLGRLV